MVFLCTLTAFLFGWLCDVRISNMIKNETPVTAHIIAAVTGAFLMKYGFTPLALRCIFLMVGLIIIGAIDSATHEIPNPLHLLIIFAGLIQFQPLPALLGFLLVPLTFLIAAIKTEKIGGGDVKLMAVSGFALGVTAGWRMMVWGLTAALFCNQFFHKGKESFPLAPYLAFGCFMALFLS